MGFVLVVGLTRVGLHCGVAVSVWRGNGGAAGGRMGLAFGRLCFAVCCLAVGRMRPSSVSWTNFDGLGGDATVGHLAGEDIAGTCEGDVIFTLVNCVLVVMSAVSPCARVCQVVGWLGRPRTKARAASRPGLSTS